MTLLKLSLTKAIIHFVNKIDKGDKKMNEFNALLKSFDLNYFGTAQHKMGIEKAMALAIEEKAFILDVRTNEEVALVKFGFATHIPTHEIPDRLSEIPRDKTIAILCVSGTRATMISMYLQVNGYENVKIVPESHSEIVALIKPGSVFKGFKG